MRRLALLLLLAISLILLPCHLRAGSDDEPYKQAEKLALQERYEEAVARMQQLELDASPNSSNWLQSKTGLCVTYSLWGKSPEALNACNKALSHHYFDRARKCIADARLQKPPVSIAQLCPGQKTRHELMLYLRLWQILAYWRAGERERAIKAMESASIIADIAKDYPSEDEIFVVAITSYILNIFEAAKNDYRYKGKDTAPLEHLRIVFTYGGESTPAGRAARTARMLWAEHPYAKPAVFALGAILLSTAIYVPARRPINRLASGLLFTSVSFLTYAVHRPLKALGSGALAAGKSIPRHVNLWLHPARPVAPPSPVATPAAAPSPAFAPAPAPMPMYVNYRYPNQAYRLAGYCFAAFWAVLLGPLVLAMLMPAFTLLADFSTSGFQRAYNHFLHILTASLTWARLWFALLLFSLFGFVVFKLYGRFSLPKRMRPPIRVVYGTLRFAFLGAILTAVGTFLSYFTATFTGLYSNPLVKTLISLIRKIIGV